MVHGQANNYGLLSQCRLQLQLYTNVHQLSKITVVGTTTSPRNTVADRGNARRLATSGGLFQVVKQRGHSTVAHSGLQIVSIAGVLAALPPQPLRYRFQ